MGATFSLKIKNRKRIPADALNFLDPLPMAAAFNLTPSQALDYFSSKGLKPTFSYLDMMGQEHDYAFTVAGMMDADLLHDVRKAVDSAIATGQSMREFEKELTPLLQKKGWWGDKELLDPLTGEWVPKNLGSPHRLELIFKTNLLNSYAAGQWEQIQRQKEIAPFLMYDAVDDGKTREAHAQWDGKVLPVDSPFWNTHYPPNGYNCRCGVIQLDQDDLDEMGITPSAEPKLKMQPWTNPRTGKPGIVHEGLDPGWNKNPGAARVAQMKQYQAEKLMLFPPDMVEAFKKGNAKGAQKAAGAEIAAKAAKAQAEAAKAELKGTAATQKAKAMERAAQFTIDQHIKDNTPYLASAIKQLQDSKAGQGMNAQALLQAAQEKALKAEQNSMVQTWKKAMIAGKEPSPKASAYVATLPDEVQLAMKAEIDAKNGTLAAKEELKAIAAGTAEKQTKLKQTIFNQWTKNGKAAEYDNPKDLLSAIVEEAAQQQAKKETASAISGYKKKVLAGQLPTDKQKAVFNSLPDAEKAKVIAAIDKAKQDQQGEELLQMFLNPEPPKTPDPKPAPKVTPVPNAPDTPLDEYAQLFNKLQDAGIEDAEFMMSPATLAKKPDLLDDALANAKQIAAANGIDAPKAPKAAAKAAPKADPEPTPTGKPVSFDNLSPEKQYEVLWKAYDLDEEAGIGDWPTPEEMAKLPEDSKMGLLQVMTDATQDIADVSGMSHKKNIEWYIEQEFKQGAAWAAAKPKAPPAGAKAPKYIDLTPEQQYEALWEGNLVGDFVDDVGLQDEWPTPKQFKLLPDIEKQEKLAHLTSVADELAESMGNDSAIEGAQDYISDQFKKGLLDAAPEPTTTPVINPIASDLDMKNMTQIGGQGGSNPGGMYQDTTTGQKWYIKTPQTSDHAMNEVLTSKLYQAAGIDVAEVDLIDVNGKTGVASKIIDDLKPDKAALTSGAAKGVEDGFAVDAWLGNWDVVGMDYDNLLVKGGKAYRIDTGGGLLYRAQGGAKGASFGKEVLEIDSLRNPGSNAQAAAVFGNISQDGLDASVRRVLKLDDGEITSIVMRYGPGDAQERADLASLLIARKANLAEQFPHLKPKPKKAPKPKDAGDFVSKAEIKEIDSARVNGYTRLTDGGDIEDHNLRITRITDSDGKQRLLVSTKLTEQGVSKIRASTGGARKVDLEQTRKKVEEVVKGIGRQHIEGGTFREKDILRLKLAKKEIADALAELEREYTKGTINAATNSQVGKRLNAWRLEVNWMLKQAKEGQPAIPWRKPVDISTAPSYTATEKGTAGMAAFTRTEGAKYHLSKFERSHVRVGGSEDVAYGRANYQATIDGVEVRVFDDQGYIYNRGFTQFKVDKPEQIEQVLKQMGIDASRPTQLQRDEVLLNAIAKRRTHNTRRNGEGWEQFIALDKIENQEARYQAKLQWVNREAGFDITKRPSWANREEALGFGHGRVVHLRPDMDTPEFNEWADNHSLYHNPNGLYKNNAGTGTADQVKIIVDGGGSLTSLLDRQRRGIQESFNAAAEDYANGGAGYVFTRIKKATDRKATGIYWKPKKHMRRSDRISYSTDKYGNIQDHTQKMLHQETVAEFERDVLSQNDETIFKDGLSLFNDLDSIVVFDKAEQTDLIRFMNERGYKKWPDGRKLEEVIVVRSGG